MPRCECEGREARVFDALGAVLAFALLFPFLRAMVRVVTHGEMRH